MKIQRASIDRNESVNVSWAGDNPYFVVIETKEPEGRVMYVIDLDEQGWMSEIEGLMRLPGQWTLYGKGPTGSALTHPVLMMVVEDGEQPYYAKKHIGVVYGGGGKVILHGIGKKRKDGQTQRMWVLPGGAIASGDDGDIIAVTMLKNANYKP